MKINLPLLTYNYDALEPYIDKQTMEIHYTKHHQTYVNKTNIILNKIEQCYEQNIFDIIKNLHKFPLKDKSILRNNAGGHINHSIFWKCLKKHTLLTGSIKNAIEHEFSSITNFKSIFEEIAINHFGSGWIWLVIENNILKIVATNNQDNPLMGADISGVSGVPILGLDIWEHAYYLKYKNNRIDYIKAFWNIINWDEVNTNFNKFFKN